MEPTAVGRGRVSLHITGRICSARLHTTRSDLTSRPEDRVCILSEDGLKTPKLQVTRLLSPRTPRTSLINHRHGFRDLFFFGLQATVLNYSSIFINAYSTLPYFFFCFKCFKNRSPEKGDAPWAGRSSQTDSSEGFKGP